MMSAVKSVSTGSGLYYGVKFRGAIQARNDAVAYRPRLGFDFVNIAPSDAFAFDEFCRWISSALVGLI